VHFLEMIRNWERDHRKNPLCHHTRQRLLQESTRDVPLKNLMHLTQRVIKGEQKWARAAMRLTIDPMASST
jgi:hypothetical protein